MASGMEQQELERVTGLQLPKCSGLCHSLAGLMHRVGVGGSSGRGTRWRWDAERMGLVIVIGHNRSWVHGPRRDDLLVAPDYVLINRLSIRAYFENREHMIFGGLRATPSLSNPP